MKKIIYSIFSILSIASFGLTLASCEEKTTITPSVDKTLEETPTKEVESKTPTLEHVHNYSIEVINPTCDNPGYTKYTCECGVTYTDNITDALNHDFTESMFCKNCNQFGITDSHVTNLVNSIKTINNFEFSYKDPYTLETISGNYYMNLEENTIYFNLYHSQLNEIGDKITSYTVYLKDNYIYTHELSTYKFYKYEVNIDEINTDIYETNEKISILTKEYAKTSSNKEAKEVCEYILEEGLSYFSDYVDTETLAIILYDYISDYIDYFFDNSLEEPVLDLEELNKWLDDQLELYGLTEEDLAKVYSKVTLELTKLINSNDENPYTTKQALTEITKYLVDNKYTTEENVNAIISKGVTLINKYLNTKLTYDELCVLVDISLKDSNKLYTNLIKYSNQEITLNELYKVVTDILKDYGIEDEELQAYYNNLLVMINETLEEYGIDTEKLYSLLTQISSYITSEEGLELITNLVNKILIYVNIGASNITNVIKEVIEIINDPSNLTISNEDAIKLGNLLSYVFDIKSQKNTIVIASDYTNLLNALKVELNKKTLQEVVKELLGNDYEPEMIITILENYTVATINTVLSMSGVSLSTYESQINKYLQQNISESLTLTTIFNTLFNTKIEGTILNYVLMNYGNENIFTVLEKITGLNAKQLATTLRTLLITEKTKGIAEALLDMYFTLSGSDINYSTLIRILDLYVRSNRGKLALYLNNDGSVNEINYQNVRYNIFLSHNFKENNDTKLLFAVNQLIYTPTEAQIEKCSTLGYTCVFDETNTCIGIKKDDVLYTYAGNTVINRKCNGYEVINTYSYEEKTITITYYLDNNRRLTDSLEECSYIETTYEISGYTFIVETCRNCNDQIIYVFEPEE